MKKNKFFFKLCALITALLLSLPFLTSCVQNDTVVGTVNGKEVYYDELRFLVSSYKDSVIEKHGDNKELVNAELDRLVMENITANYAILALCEKHGLKYESIENDIDDELDLFITENFNGSRSDFRDSCKEFGLSERYVRYTLGLELLYNQLPAIYVKNKLVHTEEADIIAYIKDNFIRVNHLVLFNDEGEDEEANRAKIAEAKRLLDGGASINSLIGRGFSEDFGDPDASGYYITRGTMIKDYEDAAFALEIGEYSDIISTYSENNSGEYVPCYYIIQRLDMSDEYIDTYYNQLKSDYYNSVINSDVDEIAKELVFVPNEKYEKLDLTELPDAQNITLIIVISSVSAVAVITVIIILVVKHNLKKKNLSYKAKLHGRKA